LPTKEAKFSLNVLSAFSPPAGQRANNFAHRQ
jgi:hypothetical protein